MSEQIYQCTGCGLHYQSEVLATQCQEFCSAHRACNPDVTKHSVELAEKTHE